MPSLDALSQWALDHRNLSRSTREQYVRKVRNAEAWIRENLGKPLSRATADDLEKYFFSPAVKASISNRNGIRNALVCYFAMLDRKKNPARELPVVYTRTFVPRALEPEAAKTVLLRSNGIPMPGRVAIGLWLYGGLRFSEGNFLQWPDVNYPFIRVTGKGAKTRVVGIHPELRELLSSWRSTCGCPQWVFPSPQHWRKGQPCSHSWLRSQVREALESATPHSLRHTFATRSLECQAYNLLELQEALGHSRLETTRIYLTVRPERLAEGINKLTY